MQKKTPHEAGLVRLGLIKTVLRQDQFQNFLFLLFLLLMKMESDLTAQNKQS